jgi:putative membrane protein
LSGPGLTGVFLRGVAMGAADVVPGVSGGTVAFITGIYETLLASLRQLDWRALQVLRADGVAAAWRHINGSFLLALAAGIFSSVLVLAGVIRTALERYPIPLWAFFFGLIGASALHLWRQRRVRTPGLYGVLVAGALLALAIGALRPGELPQTPLTFFISGSIAICAMILPGISGSFMLVLMGMYAPLLAALADMRLGLLACFVAGCALGLMAFARVLHALFRRFHDQTMALMTGFLVGSLGLVWPWKQTVTTYLDRHGESLPLQQVNVWPWEFARLTGQSDFLLEATILMLGGVLLVLGLEKFATITAHPPR